MIILERLLTIAAHALDTFGCLLQAASVGVQSGGLAWPAQSRERGSFRNSAEHGPWSLTKMGAGSSEFGEEAGLVGLGQPGSGPQDWLPRRNPILGRQSSSRVYH